MKKVTSTVWMSGLLALLLGVAVPGSALAGYHHYRGGYRVDCLINQLKFAWDDDDREEAAEELGKIGNLRALPALRRAAAYDEDKGVRKEAYRALRRIGYGNPVFRRPARPYHGGYACYQPFPGHPVICREVPPRRPWRRPSCEDVTVWYP